MLAHRLLRFFRWLPAVLLAAAAPATRPTTAPATAPAGAAGVDRTGRPAVTFNTNFEGGSLGRVENLSDDAFRFHVDGQYDERGHNRQASWYYFRMDHVARAGRSRSR